MSRRSNGQGHTYRVKNSYRTVIHYNGHVVTAMAATTQESRKLAKEKLEKLPKNLTSKYALPQSKIALAEYLISWLDDAHKHQIAHSTSSFVSDCYFLISRTLFRLYRDRTSCLRCTGLCRTSESVW